MPLAARAVAENLGFTEGPLWTQDGRLLVTSISRGAIYEVTETSLGVLAETGGGPNGMTEGLDGALYVAQNGGMWGLGERSADSAPGGIQVIENGGVRYVVERVEAPNDCCFGPDGRLYFTDPRGPAQPGHWSPGRVYAMTPDGGLDLLVEGPAYTNGIAFGPDAAELYVAETFGQRVLVYPFDGGRLGDAREFCRTEPGFPDGMCFDAEGRLYVAATFAAEVQVFDREGTRIDALQCGDGALVTNCCFGGADGKMLFVTDSRGERVLAFDLDSAGLPLFPFR